MTHMEMQQIVLDKMTEKLQDTVDMRTRITQVFTAWFQGLVAPPPPPEEAGGAPSGPPPEEPPPEAGPPPEGPPA